MAVGGQRNAPIYPWEGRCTHITGDWLGPSAQSGPVRKIQSPLGFDPRIAKPIEVTIATELSRPTGIFLQLLNFYIAFRVKIIFEDFELNITKFQVSKFCFCVPSYIRDPMRGLGDTHR